MFKRLYDKTDKPIGRVADWSSVIQLILSLLVMAGLSATLIMSGVSEAVNQFTTTFGWFGVGLVTFLLWLMLVLTHELLSASRRTGRVTLAYLIGLISIFGLLTALVLLSREHRPSAETRQGSPDPAVGETVVTPVILSPVTPGPEYVSNINLSFDPEGGGLNLSAVARVTIPRLRVFMDVSSRLLLGDKTWQPAERVPVLDVPDVYRGQVLSFGVGQRAEHAATLTEGRRVFLGTPARNFGFMPGPNKLRIAFVGPDGKEQHQRYIVVIEDLRQNGRSLTLIMEQEIGVIRGFE